MRRVLDIREKPSSWDRQLRASYSGSLKVNSVDSVGEFGRTTSNAMPNVVYLKPGSSQRQCIRQSRLAAV